MKRTLIIGLLAAVSLLAQSEKFIGSVRISPDRGACPVVAAACTEPGSWGGSAYTARNISLNLLVGLAYGIDDNTIENVDRLGSKLYDVSVKPENGGSVSYQRAQPMLQALLKERFGLQTHHDTKQESGFALVVAKGGPKLEESDTNAKAHGVIMKGRLIHPAANLDLIADLLSRPLGKPVLNQTGISGTYKLDLRFAPEGSEATQTANTRPSIFTAIQEQLGLKLEPHKVTTDILVIDQCNPIPSDN